MTVRRQFDDLSLAHSSAPRGHQYFPPRRAPKPATFHHYTCLTLALDLHEAIALRARILYNGRVAERFRGYGLYLLLASRTSACERIPLRRSVVAGSHRDACMVLTPTVRRFALSSLGACPAPPRERAIAQSPASMMHLRRALLN